MFVFMYIIPCAHIVLYLSLYIYIVPPLPLHFPSPRPMSTPSTPWPCSLNVASKLEQFGEKPCNVFTVQFVLIIVGLELVAAVSSNAE